MLVRYICVCTVYRRSRAQLSSTWEHDVGQQTRPSVLWPNEEFLRPGGTVDSLFRSLSFMYIGIIKLSEGRSGGQQRYLGP